MRFEPLEALLAAGDFDALLSRGVMLVSAGRLHEEARALAWLAESPGPDRLDRVCGLVAGSWAHPRRRLDEAPVRALLAARDGLDLPDQVAYDFAVALLRALQSNVGGAAGAEAEVALRAQAAAGLSNPALDRALRALMEQIPCAPAPAGGD